MLTLCTLALPGGFSSGPSEYLHLTVLIFFSAVISNAVESLQITSKFSFISVAWKLAVIL